MTNEEKQRIEDYINTYRVYPEEYVGRRDKKILTTMSSNYKVDIKSNTITRLEGRINSNGDFELVGSFTFPIGRPEEKIPAVETIDIEYITSVYNSIVNDLGYEDRAIVPGSDRANWTLRDMVAEIDYIRSTYVYDGANSGMKKTEPIRYKNDLARLHRFLRTHRDQISDIVAYTKHNSKYDNLITKEVL